jgi:serine/threonine protein kinase
MDGGSVLNAGDVLAGQFRVRHKIGEGGMGAMYLAEQSELDRLVAIKVVNSAMASVHPQLLERFKREARALAQLQHPNVVQLYTIGQTECGLPFLAMEYVAGNTLAEELRRGPMRLERAVDIARQVASALTEVHARGVVHRDLKPDNIMLTRSSHGAERVKVVDFGIAKMLDRAENLTVAGGFFGTPQYVAPEQARSQPVDARTDIYSLGLVFYELLTGRSPFDATAPFDLLAQQISVKPSPPSQRCGGLPPSVDAIVLRCLEKQPEHRYQNASELERDLERALEPASNDSRMHFKVDASARVMQSRPPATPRPLEREIPAEDDWRDASPAMAGAALPRWTPPSGRMGKRPRRFALGNFVWLFAVFGVGAPIYYLARDSGTREAAAVQFVHDATATISHNRTPGSDPLGAPRSYASSASGTEALTQLCINFLSDSVLDNGARYMRWAGRGPTLAKAKDVGGISSMRSDRECLESIVAVRANPSLDAELKRLADAYGSAFSSLIPLVNEAASYYDARTFEKDGFEQGRAMHAPLVAALETYNRADRVLRSALLERSLAEEPRLLARLREGGGLNERDRPCKLAVAELRRASRMFVNEGNPPGADLQRIDRGAFTERLDEFSAAIERLPEVCGARESSYESASRRLLDHATKLQRRLDAGARYTARERASLEHGSPLTVKGSPVRMVREAKYAISSLNATKLMREARIAEVAPIERLHWD